MAKNIKKRSASHIYFGVNKLTGELKHISEVPSGQKCNCICAACLQPFEARKGTRRRHHFAHVSNYECMYASEVAIYKAFAEALKQSGFLALPPVMLRFPAWHDPELLQEARRLKIDSVAFECEPLSYPPLLRVTMQGTPLRILLDFDRYYDDDDRVELAEEKAAFPDNETFADCLRTKNIYAMLPRYKAYLFERIENGDSNEYKDIYGRLDSGEYTIEHIMPQKLTPAWTSELGQDAENIHGEWLHTLANLTLTAYNSKYSNAPFNEKKTMADGYLQSGIRMTQWIAQKEHWSLPELEERCKYLTQQAASLWPYANSSYTPPQKQYEEVSLDDDITLTGHSIVKYRFRGIEHETTSWVEMYTEVLKELHNGNKAYLNYLADADDSVDLSIQVTRSPDEFSSSVKIDDDIYIWTGTATQYKVNLLRKFFEQYKQDPSDLVFFLDDSKGIGSDEEIERYKIRRKYWESVLPSLQEATGTFLNISPSKNNSIMGATARSGVYLCCVANYDSARVEIF